MCALPRSVVHCTILSYRTVLCSHLPSHLSDNHQSSADTPALFYTLLQLCIDKKEYTVLHADLASPLLTRDTFLVETTKVTPPLWKQTCMLILCVRDAICRVNYCSIYCSQYRECLKAPWLVVGSQVRRLFGGEDPDIAICHEGRYARAVALHMVLVVYTTYTYPSCLSFSLPLSTLHVQHLRHSI